MLIRVVAGLEQPIRTSCRSNDDTDGSLSTSGCGQIVAINDSETAAN